jgi:hypothetical protein
MRDAYDKVEPKQTHYVVFPACEHLIDIIRSTVLPPLRRLRAGAAALAPGQARQRRGSSSRRLVT